MDNLTPSKSWFIEQLNLYQAANNDHEAIKSNFKIRLEEFRSIVDSLLNKGKNDPLQHELILGRRGSGKSTLLKRIEIEVLENEKLSKSFIPVNLAEEQAGIYRLFDLWEQVINELNCHYSAGIQVPDFSTFSDNNAYCRQLHQLIHQYCKNAGKRLVLLLDNFDRIVENLADDGNLLREILINYNDIAIVGASTRMEEHFWRYDLPFFDFFRYHRLEALSREELNLLLIHWSESLKLPQIKSFLDKYPGKVENVRLLTDGLPRTLQFFMQMVIHDNQMEGYDYLKKIMDHATPLYQERLRYMTPQLRKIVLEMAFIWEACSTKELVEACRMESKLVSANLNTLFEKGIVEKIEMTKKNHLYRISERFFNLWLIITQGNPEQKRKTRWLSIFIENWYDAVDIKKLAKDHVAKLESGVLSPKDAIIMSKAFSQSRFVATRERDRMLELTEELTRTTQQKLILELPQLFSSILEGIFDCIRNKDFNKAIRLINSIENEEDGYKFYLLGSLYYMQSDFDKTEVYLNNAIKQGFDHALLTIGSLFAFQNRLEEAEKAFLMGISRNLPASYTHLAFLYKQQSRLTESEKYYKLGIDAGDTNAIRGLAGTLRSQGKYDEAEKFYLLAIDNGDKEALKDIINLYYETNKKKDTALEIVKKNTELFSDDLILIIEIWNGIFKEVESRLIDVFIKQSNGHGLLLFKLLVHHQYQIVIKLFNHRCFGEELKKQYKLLYYASKVLENKNQDSLIIRIPPEIRLTLEELISSIRYFQNYY